MSHTTTAEITPVHASATYATPTIHLRPTAAGQNATTKDAPSAASEPDAKSGWKDQQSNVLPHKKLMVVFPILALVQFTSYMDQTAVSTALPAIGSALHLGPSVSWVASSYLISSTSVQLINGRLSDIFGRKQLLLMALGMLAVGNLVTGFSQNAAMIFAFRAFSGLGGGAINALVMIIASDITTLKQRGKYNGFIGAAVALGNGLGPLLGGVVTEKIGWRWVFWYDVPWIAFVAIMLGLVLPPSKVGGGMVAKAKLIDWLGLLINVAAVLMVLIPLSEGGAYASWDSPLVTSMLAVGAVLIPAFLLAEWKVAPLPIMPSNLVLAHQMLSGFVYFANIFYVPIYLQNVRGYSATVSGAVVIPLTASQGIGSVVSGQIISKTGHYNPTIITSQLVWTAGTALQTLYSRTTSIWAVCLIGFLQGIGVGGAFQPSLVALLAHSRKADRAVMNSLRNFLRTVGGAVGLTVSGTVLNNVLKSRLQHVISADEINQLTSSASSLQRFNLSAEQREDVLDAYMKGVHYVFIMYAPIIGLCTVAAVLVKDRGVAEIDAGERDQRTDEAPANHGAQDSVATAHGDGSTSDPR